jgi:hypothetical protein
MFSQFRNSQSWLKALAIFSAFVVVASISGVALYLFDNEFVL